MSTGRGLPRRVLMTTDAVGGVWSFTLELARGLAALGTGTVLAGLGPEPSPRQAEAAREIEGLSLVWAPYRLEWMPGAGEDFAFSSRWLLDMADERRCDFVHLNGYAHARLAWGTPCLVTAHSCVLSWWRAVKGEAAPREWLAYRAATAQGLAAADVVVAPTTAFLDELLDIYGPLPATRVIANGVEPVLHRPGRKRPMVLAAGRFWDEAKNLAAVAAVAPRLDWPVVVAGETRHPAGGEAVFAGVEAVGVLEPAALARLMARATIFALPARYEPFGLAVLEAALAGCVLVLGDIPTLRELWQDAAVFVPPDDTDALEQALRGLIADPSRLARLSRAARGRASAMTAARMTRAYARLYGQLLADPHPAITPLAKEPGSVASPP